jgi:hypothetical protein
MSDFKPHILHRVFHAPTPVLDHPEFAYVTQVASRETLSADRFREAKVVVCKCPDGYYVWTAFVRSFPHGESWSQTATWSDGFLSSNVALTAGIEWLKRWGAKSYHVPKVAYAELVASMKDASS